MKALQIALAMNVAPHESANDGKVVGYDATWHDTTYDNFNFTVPGVGRRPSPFTGVTTGMFVGPDGPHEKNHSDKCKHAYSGFSTCHEPTGVNLNAHEQDHSRKPVHFRSVNMMGFATFTYALRVINERQNERFNQQQLDSVVLTVDGHPTDDTGGCCSCLWACGRCFCSNPLMRVFDCLGRVDVVFLSAVLPV